MNVDIYTHDSSLPFKLMGTDRVFSGDTLVPMHGVTVRFQWSHSRKTAIFPQVIHFEIETGAEVPFELVSSWFHGWVKDMKIEKVVIDHQEVEIHERDSIMNVMAQKARIKFD